jgi:pimeloyl-ACP methyl ester carboxylesterase
VVDETTTLRAYRDGIAWRPELLPIAAAANTLRDAVSGYDWIADNPAFTLGYAVDAGGSFTFAHGAWLSTVCHDQVPFVTDAALARLAGGSAAYRRTFAESPLPAVCEAWDVGSAPREAREPVRSNVPVLMLVGRFDPFSGPWLARRAARTLGRAFVVELPYWGYNTLGDPCAVTIRNAWIDRPTVAPTAACARGRSIEFATG